MRLGTANPVLKKLYSDRLQLLHNGLLDLSSSIFDLFDHSSCIEFTFGGFGVTAQYPHYRGRFAEVRLLHTLYLSAPSPVKYLYILSTVSIDTAITLPWFAISLPTSG